MASTVHPRPASRSRRDHGLGSKSSSETASSPLDPVDRSSLEGLQHGFDSGCNSRVWAGRGKKESIAHRWMFFTPTRPLRISRTREPLAYSRPRTTGQAPAKHRRYTRDPRERAENEPRDRALDHHRGGIGSSEKLLPPPMKRESQAIGGAKRVPVEQK